MYPKPTGYASSISSIGYRVYNGFVSGSMAYAPGAPTQEVITITFDFIPDDGSVMAVPDGPGNAPGTPVTNFTFDYGGVAGPGVIPLAVGGGTPAQAATETFLVLGAQLDNWTVTNPSAGVIVMTYTPAGFNLSEVLLTAMTNNLVNTPNEESAVTVAAVLAAPTSVLPGRFGKNYCVLPA